MEDDAPVQQSRTGSVSGFFTKLEHYRRILFKYCWVLILAVGVGVGIEWYLLKKATHPFVSAGRMIVNVKVSIPEANVYSEEFDNFLGTQATLMQSETVRNRVELRLRAERPDLKWSPVALQVSLSPKSSIFNFQAVGNDPFRTQAYLETAMEEYISLKKDLLANASTATQTGMEEKLKQMAGELEKGKQELLDYQAGNKVIFLEANGGNNAANYLVNQKRQLDERRSELQLLNSLALNQNIERLAQQGLVLQPEKADSTPTQGEPKEAGTLHNEASVQRPISTNDSARTEALLNGAPANLRDLEEACLQSERELKMLTAERGRLPQGLLPGAQDVVGLDRKIADKEIELATFRDQAREELKDWQHTLEVQVQELEKEVKEKEAEAVEASRQLSAFEALKESQQRLQARYDQMEGNLQTLEVDKGIGQQSVTILEKASPPAPVPPERLKHLIMAALVGLVIGIGIVVFIDQLDDRPTSFAELEKIFGMPVLGQFPLVKTGNKIPGGPILSEDDSRYPLIEASNSLRSALLYGESFESLSNERPKSIVIASARPNDGKSMVSANFAITLAQAGFRVLLIDADLRRGNLHSYFSVEASPGLSEVLSGECPWTRAVAHTSVSNLDLLPSGTSPRNPGNLFIRTGKFLAEIAGQYDYYLFDTSPVLVADDVLSLAPQVDGLLMVIRAGFTSGRIAQSALAMLQARKVNVIGLVFNAVNPKASDYYYKYKGYYAEKRDDKRR